MYCNILTNTKDLIGHGYKEDSAVVAAIATVAAASKAKTKAAAKAGGRRDADATVDTASDMTNYSVMY